MFKKLYNKFIKKKDKVRNTDDSMIKLQEALRPTKGIEVVFEEITEYEIKGHTYKLGDKVIARSNECDPLTIGTIVEFWNNDGRLSNCIPQIKDELDGKIKSHMGQLKPYSDELFKVLKPMRPLEQWNYLLPNDIKKTHSYSEKEMNKKEDLYNKKIKFLKNNFVN